MSFYRYLLFLLLYTGSAAIVRGQDASVVTPSAFTSSLNNYIRVWTGIRPDTTAADFTTSAYISNARLMIQYYDGLGRPVETVAKQGSLLTGGSPADIVTAFTYDSIGRTVRSYLPFAANSTGGNGSLTDGGFKLNPFQEQKWFYSDTNTNSPIYGQGETYYYGKTEYERSPLNRPLRSYGAGNNWVSGTGKGLTYNYWVNTVTDSVKIWNVTNSPFGSFGTYAVTGSYVAGELYKNLTTDENGKQVEEFKDRQNHVILKKVQLTAAADAGSGSGYSGWLSTYYVYDTVNRLRCVIQPAAVAQLPGASWSLSSTMLGEECFRYEYDSLDRPIIKKMPGAGATYMLYDQWDRLVLSQDSNLRAIHQWLFTKYDVLDRPVITGLYTDNTHTSISSEQIYLNSQDTGRYETYNNANYPEYSLTHTFPSVISGSVLTYTYYDDYSWAGRYGAYSTKDNSFDSYFATPSNTTYPYPQALTQSTATMGLVTGIWDSSGTGLLTAIFYDDHKRVLQTKYLNYTAAVDINTTQYSFTGQPLMTVSSTIKAGNNTQTTVTLTQISYDSLGRSVRIQKKISNSLVASGTMPSSWETTVQNTYNALGELSIKQLGNKPGASPGTPLANLAYAYNIRGWLLSINKSYVDAGTNSDQYFGQELGYDKNASLGTFITPQYNGNIGGMLWKGEGDQAKRKYDFTYDAANRLTAANFNQYVSGTGSSATFDRSAGLDYSVSGLSYDANGNILAMLQKGWKLTNSPTIDSLTYTYQTGSNKLQQVTDGANDSASTLADFHYKPSTKGTTDYSYDGDGNLIADNNKSITSITYNYLSLPSVIAVRGKGTIQYWYDASGKKLQKQVVDSTISPRRIVTTLYLEGGIYQNDTLQFLAHEEGRTRLDTTGGSAQLIYEYFVKDHLGNTRMVLTEQSETDAYPDASLETASIANERLYYASLDSGRINKSGVGGYPNDTYTSPNDYIQQLSASGYKVGANIVIAVMAGDTVNIRANSWYRQNGVTPGTPVSPLSSLVAGLAGGITGAIPGHYGLTQLQQPGVLDPGITNFLNSKTYSTSKPKAFLNWILFDLQFNMVATSSGFQQVGNDTTFTTHTVAGQVMSKSGFLFVYVSNETPNINVYFDNLQLTHIRGRILEETHYYPFGLTMAGISAQAAGKPENKYLYNGKELQHKEFHDGTGLEEYDYGARMYDVQIGRWNAQDPKSEKYLSVSPYTYGGNNPIYYVDPSGMIIDPFSKDQWDKEKQAVIDQENVLVSQMDKITANASKFGWDNDKLTDELGDLNDRVQSLKGTLNNLGVLESSKQVYSLGSAEDGVGGTVYDPTTGNIVFNVGSTANFVHETTHGGQFEAGEIAFNKETGSPLAGDIFDEIGAYKAQYAYDPSSISGLKSNSIANSSDDIKPAWVQNLTANDGSKPYDVGGKAHTGIIPLNINSTKEDYLKAYPSEAKTLNTVLPDNFTIKSFSGTYYKQ